MLGTLLGCLVGDEGQEGPAAVLQEVEGAVAPVGELEDQLARAAAAAVERSAPEAAGTGVSYLLSEGEQIRCIR